jgi:serine/threonine protein kinase
VSQVRFLSLIFFCVDRPHLFFVSHKTRFSIFLKHGNGCVLADGGLARRTQFLQDKTYAAQMADSVRWAAPEVLELGQWNSASDVYSLGMTLVEACNGGRVPFADLADLQEVRLAVTAGRHPALPSGFPVALEKLVRSCWEAGPAQRPSAAELARDLDAIAISLAETEAGEQWDIVSGVGNDASATLSSSPSSGTSTDRTPAATHVDAAADRCSRTPGTVQQLHALLQQG